MNSRSTWAWVAVLAVWGGLVASGCGGASASSQSVTGGGAAITPADATAFVAVDSDLSSSQWTATQKLMDKFPGKDRALAMLKQSFERSSNGITWNEVKQGLGTEVDVAVFATPKPYVVGMTQPKDASAWSSLVSKGNAAGGSTLHVADYKGWKIFSDSQAHLDAFEQGGASGMLSDDASYKSASGTLSGDALAKVYANGPELAGALKQAAPKLGLGAAQAGGLTWAAGQLLAGDNGLSLELHAKSETSATATPKAYEAKLPNDIPAGVLAYLSFSGEGLKSGPLSQALKGLSGIPQAAALVPIIQQLAPIFAHENALYVREAGLIPEVTLVAQPDSPQQAVSTIDGLVALVGSRLGGATPKTVTIGGVQAKELSLGRFSIFYGAVDGKLVVSTAEQAFSEVGGSGQKLADDSTFTGAQKAAGMPAATNGFVYLDLKDAIPLVESLAQLGNVNISSQVTDNLRPLHSLVAWAAADGSGQGSATIFLGVD